MLPKVFAGSVNASYLSNMNIWSQLLGKFASVQSFQFSSHRTGDATIRSTAISHRSQHFGSILFTCLAFGFTSPSESYQSPVEGNSLSSGNLSPSKTSTPGTRELYQLTIPRTILSRSAIGIAINTPLSFLGSCLLHPTIPLETSLNVGYQLKACTLLLRETAFVVQEADLCPIKGTM